MPRPDIPEKLSGAAPVAADGGGDPAAADVDGLMGVGILIAIIEEIIAENGA